MKYSKNFALPSITKVSTRYGGFIPDMVFLLCLLVGAGSVSAQISIVGVVDKGIYPESVSFTVNSEAGYDYAVELNGAPVPTDVYIEVDEPEYYELYVYRHEQSSGNEETELVRFVVRASERGNTEIGLPVWTPYPPIDSAAAEFAGARLQIVTPAQYPQGLEIPIIARVENGSGNRLGLNGTVTAVGFEDYPLQLLRGVGSVFLPPNTEPGIISYSAEIQILQCPNQIIIEPSTIWQTVSSDITTSIDWGENARIHITGVTGDLLTINSGATLTIGAGSIILIDPNIEIAILGKIVVNGTLDRPVVFTPQDREVAWGGFLFETGSSVGEFTGAIITGSGADANWFNNNPGHGSAHLREQCLFYLSNGAHVTLTNCYMVGNHGQMGHGESGYLTMTGCLAQKFVTCGQYNRGAVIAEDSAFIEFPSATAPFVDGDNDAFYLSGGAHSLTDCLIGYTLDDGIDAGQGAAGSVTVDGCWLESCYHEAMAWSSGPRYADVIDTVVLNCGQAIECGYDDPFVDVVKCLCTSNVIGARFGDNYDRTYNGFLTVTDSLLLFNIRDVWGRAWDDWTVHFDHMDIHDNYLSAPNANYPNNQLWDPQAEPNQLDLLEPFLAWPAGIVGIGIATLEDSYDLAELSDEIPVRLSTFCPNTVSVDYAIYTEDGLYDSGSLQFIPGETLKHIQFNPPPIEDISEFQVTLSNPVNAEITNFQQITCLIPSPLIVEGDQWRYFKGTTEPPADWNQLGFNDDTWLIGPTGIGYETSSGYESCIATNLSDMRNNYISVYARREFSIEDPSQLISLTFTIDWDDGYIAYINGIQIASRYAPDPPVHDQPAGTDNHEACCGTGTPSGPCPPEKVDLSDYINNLVAGNNVLAVQVHNTSLSSSDFLFIPTLTSIVNPRPGDIEPDGDVDPDNFSILASTWMTQNGQDGYKPVYDIDTIPPEGTIDLLDIIVFVEHWLSCY